MTDSKIAVWIDVGGTFTDCLRALPDGSLQAAKVLSTGEAPGAIGEVASGRTLVDHFRAADPTGLWADYEVRWFDEDGHDVGDSVVESSDGDRLLIRDQVPAAATSYTLSAGEEAPLLGIRKLLGLPRNAALPKLSVRLGTTRGTNALLTRRGARCALMTTRGFGDLLRIGNQDRPRLFDLDIVKPDPLFEVTIEVEERLAADGSVLKSLDVAAVRSALEQLLADGIQSLAVCLLHASIDGQHERQVEAVARDLGFRDVRLSHESAPVIRAVPRGQTTVLDAYLDPVLREYVGRLTRALAGSELLLMTSSGGLVAPEFFTGKDSILSGPAGGVVGCAQVAEAAGFSQAIGFDMGGTSTDVSRYGDGQFQRQYESVKAGVQIVTPSLAIETVAAGGGSICEFDGVKLTVGPDSAGSNPGPACYGRGGPLTVTDLNLFLGRIPSPELTARLFPKLGFPIPLNVKPVADRLDELIERIEAATNKRYPPQQLCEGFLQIANENMARAAKSISIDRGFDPAEHVMVAFGGAAAQHACPVADALGIQQILIHPQSGLLSAFGIGHASLVRHRSQQLSLPVEQGAVKAIAPKFEPLLAAVNADLAHQGVPSDAIKIQRYIDVCYQGLDASLTLPWHEDIDLKDAYEAEHERLYGFRQARPIEVTAIRVEGASHTDASPKSERIEASVVGDPATTVFIHQQKSLTATLHQRESLPPGATVLGPAIILDEGATTVVDLGWTARLLSQRELLLTRERDNAPAKAKAMSRDEEHNAEVADPTQLELFNNRFAGIAEQMGITLRNTSCSVNVKERLDFSCAIFTPSGDLVVNAPHIPVHLGAMSQTVRCVIEDTGQLAPGDVIVTNDPFRGGSHLPDVTVVLPVFRETTGGNPAELLFFTASRAHHAEIGGITPGSMPPFSTKLSEEGVLIRNFKLIDGGRSQFDAMRELLQSGEFPSRKPDENLADLAAQVAACRQGARDLLRMCQQYGTRRVLRYMIHMQAAAAFQVRRALRRIGNARRQWTDHLDNGAQIAVAIDIHDGEAVIDFAGTDDVLPTNLNANAAIVSAAVMYCLRCLIDEDIPLNEGVLEPVDIKLPVCLLNPPRHEDATQCAAVVGGNVETSQRVVDVLLGAFKAAAASQGTMNNLTFGDDQFGYYETICGGAGATPTADGADAVHTHMTNTRLTDPEVLESRHPVRLLEFSIRHGSHGTGAHRGGDGIIRRIEFLAPLTVSLLTQRRITAPFGLEGGMSGAPGKNLLRRQGATNDMQLDECCQFTAGAGDVLTIMTPGGGGYGSPAPTEGSDRGGAQAARQNYHEANHGDTEDTEEEMEGREEEMEGRVARNERGG